MFKNNKPICSRRAQLKVISYYKENLFKEQLIYQKALSEFSFATVDNYYGMTIKNLKDIISDSKKLRTLSFINYL